MTELIMINGEAIDVPAMLASKYGHCPAAGYVTGGWPIEWTEADFQKFARKMRIDQSASPETSGNDARCYDVETGAGKPQYVRRFIESRSPAIESIATIYCALETVPSVIQAVGSIAEIPRFWLAWFWNRPGFPTVAQVLAELDMLTGVALPEHKLWACQAKSYAQYELSAVYGNPDFDR